MQMFNLSTINAYPVIEINGLRKYTNYSFRVQVVNSAGAGNYSPPFYLMTDQDSKCTVFNCTKPIISHTDVKPFDNSMVGNVASPEPKGLIDNSIFSVYRPSKDYTGLLNS